MEEPARRREKRDAPRRHMPDGESRQGKAAGYAGGLGIIDVDVVNAHAAADDELELAALGLVDLCGADLGLGADDDHVEVTQGLAQLGGLVELLDDLVTLSLQLGHRGLIHTVSNKNTHDNFLLVNFLKWFYLCSASNFLRKSTSACAPSMGMAL